MNDNTGAINDGLNSARTKFFNLCPDKIDNRGGLGDFFGSTNLRELAADKIDNQWAGQINRA